MATSEGGHGSHMSTRIGFAWDRHRFKDLADLGRNARDGYCANTTVTKQQGENLLTLLAEAVQYQEAHEHSQALRAEAEAEVERLRAAILDIDAHAVPKGEDDDGFVTGGYVVSVGSLHRALGLIGHTAPRGDEHAVQIEFEHGPGCEGCQAILEASGWRF